jgi:hypothetical protein
MYPRVKNVKAKENYLLEIRFTNNSCGIFDVKPYLNFGVFKELKNAEYFRKVNRSGNSIAWPHGQDICPDTLFMESKILTSKSSGRKSRLRRSPRR